jgi:hypothetical protein
LLRGKIAEGDDFNSKVRRINEQFPLRFEPCAPSSSPRAPPPPDPPLPHIGDRKRQLPLKSKFNRRGAENEGGQSGNNQSLTLETLLEG